jgi:hypothetical protein
MGAEGAIVASDPRRARVFRVAMTTRGPRVGVAATRGVSANDPRPNASSANAARACLEHLCDCLRALGVGTAAGASHDPTALTAETLRRAKFDQPAAAAPLWRALHDLFLVSHAGFPEPSVAAETLRVLRDETARRDDFDENETSAETETETSRRRDTDVETHRCVALRGLRLAKYPRLETLETNQESNDTFDRESFELASPSSSRAILVALAWAAADLDVFALAHADRSARDLGASGLGVPSFGDDTELTTPNESFLLPPYGSDAAASPASAEAHAAPAEAAERAYLDAAAGTIARFENNGRASGGTRARRSSLTTSHTTVKASGKTSMLEKQTALLSQRCWQSVSHVRALERSRATRRVAVVDAQRAFSRAKNEKGAFFLTATEIGLARDAGARRRAAAAMRAVLTTKDRAKETVALAETFWAWMRSVLELDEKEKKARRISASRKINASRNVGANETRDETLTLLEDESSSHRDTQRRSDDRSDRSSSECVFLPNTNYSVVAELETAARRLGPALRRRRRDVETVARTWRATREASRSDPERYAELSALAMAAAARTPSLASFKAGARAKLTAAETAETVETVETVETAETVETVETRESGNEKDPPSGFSFDFASARSPDDAPAPPGVAEALALRRGDTGSNPAGNAAGGEDGTSRTVVRFGSSLLPSSGAKKSSARRSETCAEAAARLRDSLDDAEALLEAQRSRAVDALRREITHAFLENGDATLAPAAVHGWDR